MPLLMLLRFPGVFLVLADVLAGYMLIRFSGHGLGNLKALAFLLGAVACLYMSVMAWRDVFDAEADMIRRPDRPIPSGLVSLNTGFMVACVLSVTGMMLAMAAGMNGFMIAGAFLVVSLANESVAHRVEILNPVCAGLARSLAIVLGMSTHAYMAILITDPMLYLPLVMVGVYCAAAATLEPIFSARDPEKKKPEVEEYPSDAETILDNLEGEAAAVGRESEAAVEEAAPVAPENDCAVQQVAVRGLLGVGGGVMLLVPLAGVWLMPLRVVGVVLFTLVFALLLKSLQALVMNCRYRQLVRFVFLGLVMTPVLEAAFVVCLASHVPVAASGLLSRFSMPSLTELSGVLLVAVCSIPALVLGRRIGLVTA